jgi:hypothetical protein
MVTGLLTLAKASFRPRMGSAGPMGTFSAVQRDAKRAPMGCATLRETSERRIIV